MASVTSPGWVHPRRRQRRRLGHCDVTWHAVDSYLNRVPGACAVDAKDVLREIAAGARLCGRTPTGEEIWQAGEMRFLVWRVARRTPMLLTVYYVGANGD